jgi:hypothetical protein
VRAALSSLASLRRLALGFDFDDLGSVDEAVDECDHASGVGKTSLQSEKALLVLRRTLYLETMERCRKLELGLQSEHLPKDETQLSLDVLTMVLDDGSGRSSKQRSPRRKPRASRKFAATFSLLASARLCDVEP